MNTLVKFVKSICNETSKKSLTGVKQDPEFLIHKKKSLDQTFQTGTEAEAKNQTQIISFFQ